MDNRLEDIIECLQQPMQQFKEAFDKNFHTDDALLNTILAHTNSLKGKRIRPLLVFLIAKTFGDITPQTLRAAVIIELLHTASLLHDDVIDSSKIRRNKTTVNALFGDRPAILVGDYLYGKALATIKTQEDFNLMDVFARIALNLPAGEIKETDITNGKDTSIESYSKVIYYKTASLICAATECGARSCGNKDVNLQEIAELGEHIGMAFQIRDDILDYDANNLMGKGLGNDIREKKITLPFIHYLETLSDKEKDEAVDFFFGDNKSKEEIEDFIKKVNESGALQKTFKVQKDYSDKALKIVDNMPLNEYSINLRALVQYLTIRNK